MSSVALGSESDNSKDSDYEIIKCLKSREDTRQCVANFKAARKRLKKKGGETTPSGVRKRSYGSLCDVCRRVTVPALRGQGYHLPGSFESLQMSASSCSLCHLILMSIRRKHAGLDEKLTASEALQLTVKYDDGGVSDYTTTMRPSPRLHLDEIFRLNLDPGTDGIVHIEAHIRSRITDRPYLEIRSTTRIFTTRADLSESLRIPMDIRPQGNGKFALMESWLREEIPPSSTGQWEERLKNPSYFAFPSRLIFLGSTAHLQGQQLRLVGLMEASRLSQKLDSLSHPRYVTLSHRWGLSHHFTTTKANQGAREKSFKFEELPQTYQDAAVVAAKLGYHFLWIDAVCIVQDDHKEWLRESEMMGDIYRYASFTIATHCSENDSQGFLKEAFRKRGTVKLDQNACPSVFMRAAADLDLDVSKSPLTKRGWVLQERFLSRRILHFTTGMIYWETAQGTKSEDGTLDIVAVNAEINIDEATAPVDDIQFLPVSLRTLQQFQLRATVSFRTFSGILDKHTEEEDVPLPTLFATKKPPLPSPNEWYHLVEMYSTCSLTQAKDRLVAISGIARVLQCQRKHPYLAGIWADSLPVGLWWLHVGRSHPSLEIKRASSWSWANVDGPIQFPLAGKNLKFRVDCGFLGIERINSSWRRSNSSWVNGPGKLKIRTNVLDLTKRDKTCMIRLSGRYSSIFQENLPLWEDGSKGLWTENDPPLRLYNVSDARSLRLPGATEANLSDPSYSRDKAWCVIDSARDESMHGITLDGDPFLFVTVAFVTQQDRSTSNGFEGSSLTNPFISKFSTGFHLGLLLTAGTASPTAYRRIGIAVIGQNFLERLRSIHPNARFVEQTINII